MRGSPPRIPWSAIVEHAGTVACLVLFAAVAGRVGPLLVREHDWPGLVAAGLAAYVAADLVSGAVHWFCDRFGTERTPVIGPSVIEPFREHHRDPLAITRRGFVAVNASNLLAVLPVLALAGLGEPSLGHAFLLVFALAVGLTNQLHKWAHAPRVPRAVAWLHRTRLIMPPDHHARHHRGETHAFCVTSGWCNPLLDRLGVFARLERRIRRA